MRIPQIFSSFATAVSRVTGAPLAFVLCVTAIAVWAITGPLFHFSDTWQLVINTSTNIISFLQVFLIQNTQNRESASIQAKLDELVRRTSHHLGDEAAPDRERAPSPFDHLTRDCKPKGVMRPQTSGSTGRASLTMESLAG